MNLLKRYPLDAGLPPDFGVLDARDQVYKIEKSIEDTLEESDRDSVIMAPLRGFTAEDLIGIEEFLLSIRSKLKRMEIDAGGPDALIRAFRIGMDIDALETSTRALVESPEWRAVFMQMELLLRSQAIFMRNARGQGTALAVATDILAASACGIRSCPFISARPSREKYHRKSKYVANETFPHTIYELSFQVRMACRAFSPDTIVYSGYKSNKPSPHFPARRRKISRFETQGGTAGLR
jgi:hypothetical protein